MAWSSTLAGEDHLARIVALTCQDDLHCIVVSPDGAVTLSDHDLRAELSALLMGSDAPPCLIVYLVLDFMRERTLGYCAHTERDWWVWTPEMVVVDEYNTKCGTATTDTVRTIIALSESDPWCWRWSRGAAEDDAYLFINIRRAVQKLGEHRV